MSRDFHWVRFDEETVPAYPVFRRQPGRKYSWLARLCFWTLDRLGLEEEPTARIYRLTEQQIDSLAQDIVAQQQHWWRYILRDDCRLYVGPDAHVQLHIFGALHPGDVVGFRAKVRLGYRRGWQWRGLPVTVVPWLRGAILLPDMTKESQMDRYA
jgi:hypothetical protein